MDRAEKVVVGQKKRRLCLVSFIFTVLLTNLSSGLRYGTESVGGFLKGQLDTGTDGGVGFFQTVGLEDFTGSLDGFLFLLVLMGTQG